MIFVCGIHGAGKTQYCMSLSREQGRECFSASKLILKKGKENFHQKKVDNIRLNQSFLIDEVEAIRNTGIDFILDGHLCLLNSKGKIELISKEVINALKIDLLIVLVDKPSVIQERIKQRDGIIWSEQFIKLFQEKEMKYAKKLAMDLDIDYKIVSNNIENQTKFGKSIILPVKPIYAEKIILEKKKYEFRKKLCTENIDKMYLYATAPVKKIVGEVEILEKYSMKKENLWEETREESGISEEFFNEYLKNQRRACAYKLGKPVRYEVPMELIRMGINYVPQSYVYVKTRELNGAEAAGEQTKIWTG